MTGVDPRETFEFYQPADVASPNSINFYDAARLHDLGGLPLVARDEGDYTAAGGLRLAAYNRGDSPSRDRSNLPYNATWFEHLRENYADGLRLLEGLRQAYADELTVDGELDSGAVKDVYSMGVNLPQFLLWRNGSTVRNGEIPPAASVLRQALLGVGLVILEPEIGDILELSGRDVANIAEKNGDLLGEQPFPGIPKMLCPASPDMIAGLSEALLRGNPKRGVGDFIEIYDIDIRKLRDFSGFVGKYVIKEEELMASIAALKAESPVQDGSFELLRSKPKIQRFDEIISAYGNFLDDNHPVIFESLDRTEQPPKMSLRRIYTTRKDLAYARVQIALSDDLANFTPEVDQSLRAMLPPDMQPPEFVKGFPGKIAR